MAPLQGGQVSHNRSSEGASLFLSDLNRIHSKIQQTNLEMLDRLWLLTAALLSSPSPLFCLTPLVFLPFSHLCLSLTLPIFYPFSLFTNPQPAVHSSASPSHCSFSVQGSKTLQSKSLVNSYYSGTGVHAHVHRNTASHTLPNSSSQKLL